MGGNQAVRLAIRHASQPFHNLRRVIAFNPALNPKRCAEALDARPIYLRYFRTHWLSSLDAKQRLFPELYNFAPLQKIHSITQMTEWVLEQYGEHFGNFANTDAYFEAYSISSDAFRNLTVQTTIITAANDPVVPVDDFYALTPHPLLDVQILSNGGHVGYIDLFPLRHNLPRLVLTALRQPEIHERGPQQGNSIR
jgi:predicted alpha/beta-fold hydrolase